MLFPVHFQPAMKTFLEQRGAVLVPDDSQPTRMVSIKELKELHDARQDAGRLDVSDHRQTSNSSTSSSFATGRTSIFDRRTSITACQMRENIPVESFPDAGRDAVDAPAPESPVESFPDAGRDAVDAPAPKRMKVAVAECWVFNVRLPCGKNRIRAACHAFWVTLDCLIYHWFSFSDTRLPEYKPHLNAMMAAPVFASHVLFVVGPKASEASGKQEARQVLVIQAALNQWATETDYWNVFGGWHFLNFVRPSASKAPKALKGSMKVMKAAKAPKVMKAPKAMKAPKPMTAPEKTRKPKSVSMMKAGQQLCAQLQYPLIIATFPSGHGKRRSWRSNRAVEK